MSNVKTWISSDRFIFLMASASGLTKRLVCFLTEQVDILEVWLLIEQLEVDSKVVVLIVPGSNRVEEKEFLNRSILLFSKLQPTYAEISMMS